MKNDKAYLLTVGTGDLNRLEESLFAPLRKSIGSGTWSRVVLLPSQVTGEFAGRVRAGLPDLPIDISPLPEPGQENDADRCFAHFDRVLADLRRTGFTADQIVVDFTRGTKAMSAALVLAAVRHDVVELRYIHGERDDRGQVKAGSEHILSLPTTVATAQKRLDLSRRFMISGNFAAALDVLPGPGDPVSAAWPEPLRDTAAALKPMAEFYAAWDRLDYPTAAATALPARVPADCEDLAPTDAMRVWVRRLAAPLPSEPAAMAARLRLLAADMLANGERRIRDRQFEDAILRAYRVLELTGQVRLFARGLDSARLPADHADVIALLRKLEKKRGMGFGRNKDGTLNAGRELVARLLKQMGDQLAKRLLHFDDPFPVLKVTARNTSVLIHGFTTAAPGDAAPLHDLYQGLEGLLLEDSGESARHIIAVARSLDLTVR